MSYWKAGVSYLILDAFRKEIKSGKLTAQVVIGKIIAHLKETLFLQPK